MSQFEICAFDVWRTRFFASVYDVQPTDLHFDAAKVAALSSGTMADGVFRKGGDPRPAPAHDLPFEVELKNVGNPDFRQDLDRPVPGTRRGGWKPVATLRSASEACLAYIAENDLGGGNWAGGAVGLFRQPQIQQNPNRNAKLSRRAYPPSLATPSIRSLSRMTLSIPNGVRFEPTDFFELHSRIMEWRKEVVELARRDMIRVVVRNGFTMLDRLVLGMDPEDALHPGRPSEHQSLLSWAWRQATDRQENIRRSRQRDVDVDMGFDIWIFVHQGRFYGSLNSERGEWKDLFLEKEWVEDFSFSDASDGATGVSRKDWSHRAEVWNGIFDGKAGRAFADQCYTVSCIQDSIGWSLHDPETVPDLLDERVAGHARDACLRRKEGDRLDGMGMGEIFSAYGKFLRWLETEDGRAMMAEETARVRAILAPFGLAHLRRPYPEVIAEIESMRSEGTL